MNKNYILIIVSAILVALSGVYFYLTQWVQVPILTPPSNNMESTPPQQNKDIDIYTNTHLYLYPELSWNLMPHNENSGTFRIYFDKMYGDGVNIGGRKVESSKNNLTQDELNKLFVDIENFFQERLAQSKFSNKIFVRGVGFYGKNTAEMVDGKFVTGIKQEKDVIRTVTLVLKRNCPWQSREAYQGPLANGWLCAASFQVFEQDPITLADLLSKFSYPRDFFSWNNYKNEKYGFTIDIDPIEADYGKNYSSLIPAKAGSGPSGPQDANSISVHTTDGDIFISVSELNISTTLEERFGTDETKIRNINEESAFDTTEDIMGILRRTVYFIRPWRGRSIEISLFYDLDYPSISARARRLSLEAEFNHILSTLHFFEPN